MECDGNGYCISNKSFICKYDCVLKECPNYFLCNTKCPQNILDFNNGVCFTCIEHFGKSFENDSRSNPILEVDDCIDCPICFSENVEGIKNPRCKHYLCNSCFKIIYNFDVKYEDEPLFPFPDKEEEYYLDPDFFSEDIVINSWKKRWLSWNNEKRKKKLGYNFIKHCPLCRT